jgi:hypothetical protein
MCQLQAAVVIRRQRAVERWGGVGETQVLCLPSGSLLWTIALSVKYPMLGYWAPVTGNEMRSQDKKQYTWGTKI